MYAVQRGPDEASLVNTGTRKIYTVADQFKPNEVRFYYDMDPSMEPQVYIFASKVSCSGCASIQSNTCTGPVIPATG
ncbi:hypothetical protein AAVH_17893 [Aphelenchoides avenae]|nr:hypothetical protein AAVH_17893 [Aphelenchus avenae]